MFYFSANRDERRGWLGDASLTADEALFNFDLIKFYHNYLTSITDNQRSDGAITNVASSSDYLIHPDWRGRFPTDSNWGTALATITWHIYRHYNDKQTLIDYYDHIVAYI